MVKDDLNGVWKMTIDEGECRRRSPKVQTQLSIEDPMTFDAKWPMVNVLDWCGEGRFEWSVEDDD